MMVSEVTNYLQQFAGYSAPAAAKTTANTTLQGNKYDNGHIFYALLEYIIQELPNREKYTYFYSISQKLLRVCREKDRNVATYFMEKITQHLDQSIEAEELEYHAIRSIYHPAVAYYYYYLQQDYETAAKYMTTLLTSIDFMIGHGFKDGMYMKIEQYLNTSRVYFNAGNYELSARYAREVMVYLLSSSRETFEYPFSDVVKSSSQLRAILDLFFNGLIYKSLGDPASGSFFRNSYLISVFSNLDIPFNKMVESNTLKGLEILLLISEGQEEEGLEMAINTDLFNENVPPSIQHFVLSALLNYKDTADLLPESLRNNILSYQEKVLLLSPSQTGISRPLSVTV